MYFYGNVLLNANAHKPLKIDSSGHAKYQTSKKIATMMPYKLAFHKSFQYDFHGGGGDKKPSPYLLQNNKPYHIKM